MKQYLIVIYLSVICRSDNWWYRPRCISIDFISPSKERHFNFRKLSVLCLNTTRPEYFLPNASSVNCPFDLFCFQIKLHFSNLSGSTNSSSKLKRAVREIQSLENSDTIRFLKFGFQFKTGNRYSLHLWTQLDCTFSVNADLAFYLQMQLCLRNPSNIADDF